LIDGRPPQSGGEAAAGAPAAPPGRRSRLRRAARAFVLLACLAPAGPLLAHLGLDEQIAGLSARLEREPENATLLLRRGELRRAHGDWTAAAADFRSALDRDPALHAAHLALGRLQLEEGDPAASLASVDRFLKTLPAHPGALRLRGAALVRLGRPLEAAVALEGGIAAALAAGKGDPDLYLERAAALQASGSDHLQEALSGLDEGIARLGSPASLVLAAAGLEEKLGRVDAAVARIDEAARRSRRPERWRARQGEILERSGRAAAARRAYEEALGSLAALPVGRRTRALADIEASVRAALERLEPQPETGPEQTP
jgi:tetratricopeptide (TPR) repeat protein